LEKITICSPVGDVEIGVQLRDYIRETRKSALDLVKFGTIIAVEIVINCEGWLRKLARTVEIPEPR
jgi:hypothetical protein